MSEDRKRRRGRRQFDAGRQIFTGSYLRADRALDRGQHHVFRLLWFFLPDTSIAKNPRFQAIMASRFFSDAGQQALTYGALIATVREGGSALEAALVGVAALLPPALFGLYGGAVADALPKRVALAAVYNLQALLCFVIPISFGTDIYAVLFLIFAVHTLGQVSGPTESAVVPLVASEEQLASAASLVSFASNFGVAFGTAILAPILVHIFDVRAVFYTSGVMLLLAASRVFDLAAGPQKRIGGWRPKVNASETIRWIAHERAVATMIFVAVLAGMANLVVQTLAPRYVQAVLHVDPADSVYVFGPSAIGLALALIISPPLIRWRGERIVALVGFLISATTLCLLGLVNHKLAEIIDPANPMRLLGLFGIQLSENLRTAGALAIPLGLGLSLTTTSVHTYINRRVPLSYQGRAFALQSSLKNGATIVPLLVLGASANVFGVENVLIASPVVLLAAALILVRLSFVFSGWAPPRRLDVLSSFWQESSAPVLPPEDRAAITAGLASDRLAGPPSSLDGSNNGPPAGAEGGDDAEHQGA